MAFDTQPPAYYDQIADLRHATDDVDEDAMQIRLGEHEPWHRREAGHRKHTSCGLPIREPAAMGWPEGWSLREHSYDGILCPYCFTPFELRLAMKAKKESP